MMLKDIVLVVLCTDTQKIRKFYLTDKEEISEKKSTDRFMNNVFTQVEWSISKKKLKSLQNKNWREREHQFDCCFEFDKTTKSRFVGTSYDRLSKFKRLPVAYVTIYEKDCLFW